jgi:hypothetical protein
MFLLLAVLVQYTPLRYCVVERGVLGSNCHDRGEHAVLGDSHSDEPACDDPTDGQHECICEQPKVDGPHAPQDVKSALDWAHTPVAVAIPLLVSSHAPALPDPDPHPWAPLALQLPLLI